MPSKTIASIAGIVIILSLAILKGIDGVLIFSGLAALSGLGGFALGRRPPGKGTPPTP